MRFATKRIKNIKRKRTENQNQFDSKFEKRVFSTFLLRSQWDRMGKERVKHESWIRLYCRKLYFQLLSRNTSSILSWIEVTYLKVNTTARGIMKISANDAAFRILLAWNSTSEIKNLAPHHEFCPIICEKRNQYQQRE